MYETFKHFPELKFTNRCICCGTEVVAGSPGYGSNRTAASPGRWVFVCPPCFMRDAGRPIEVPEETGEPELPTDLLEAMERMERSKKKAAESALSSGSAAHDTVPKRTEAAMAPDRAPAETKAEPFRPLLERLKHTAPWRFA
jgi:hypothetical protein